ncbi:Uncharacterised protein [Kluyvera cryocrescens]|uniref:Uncharacterized protein n=1 Tax=Kluyvera cryocrescens TaxID=580 RepID=A0A485D1C3_KLUCR|nr:Uncharacterised protein [Kluyvera cryocrescens]
MFILGLLRPSSPARSALKGSNVGEFGAIFRSLYVWQNMKPTAPVNGLRGAPRPPLQSPRPRGEIGASHCVRLRTPACGTAKLDVMSRFASARHPWRPDLVFPSPAHRFQAGTHRFQQYWRLFLTGKLQRYWRLLLAKKRKRHGWRLNRRSVAWRPGQPTGMWAEGAFYREVTSRPTRKPEGIS